MRLLRRTRRRAHRGVPLWAFLTASVCVPVLGIVALTTVIAGARVEEAASAARAERAVETLALLDTARSTVEREVVSLVVLAVVDDPAALAQLQLPASAAAAQRPRLIAERDATRAATDRALARVPREAAGGGTARRVADRVVNLRAFADAGSLGVQDVYLDYVELSDDLMTAQRSADALAASEGVPPATGRSIQDVQLIAEYAQDAGRQLPLYLGALFGGDDSLIGSQLARETGWLAYTDALEQLDGLSQERVVRQWRALAASSAVQGIDGVLDPAVPTAAPTVPRVLALVLQSEVRDAELAELVGSAVGRAQTLAAQDREAAIDRRTSTLVAGGLLLLSAALGALVLGRSVSRSLRVLAGQARQVSEGSLVEVAVRGPREVRTVSAALGSAVASLRRIQDQAAAAAGGDLDNALLDRPIPGRLGEVVHASVRQIVSAVRQREELQSALAHQAAHDPLTELPNRAQALALGGSALARGRRSGAMTGLLFVDLDAFKAVNDTHGHACGDQVLREVARRLSRTVRSGDVVCRLGGDEFVVLVEPVETESALVDLAERLIADISRPIPAGDRLVRVGASVGVAVSRDAGTDADVLFAEADAAAHRAKHLGRGRVEVFDDVLRGQLSSRATLETAIAAGLAAGEMHLHYQPVVDVGSGALRGFEALVRWHRPGHGTVAPDEFVPVAEGSPLICELDRWVLGEATRQLVRWRAEHPAGPGTVPPTMAVNISGRHLADRRVVGHVADALAASGLPAHLLVLEVTETVLVDDPVAVDHLAALRALGVSIAIDDFGTGYTSIGQLRHLPVDTLKIDRSFVSSADRGERELVALMIRAAHTFGLDVVAEGVEEPAHLEQLRAHGCDQAQGWLFSRPLPAAEAGAAFRRELAGRAPVS